MAADDKPVTVDESKPEDFEGEVATDNTIPSAELINKISKFLVLDKHGKSHTFESLYTGPNRPRRVLIIFVRHFFCGNCQHYLHTFSESITPDALLSLPVTTSVTVIGCGDPALIDMYAEASQCPYPIFTDPQRSLFKALGMTQTLQPGEQPAYMRTNMLTSSLRSVWQGIKQIPKGLVFKSGEMRQVGGEFLFEPLDITTPISEKTVPPLEQAINGNAAEEQAGEAKRVTWCHRMRTTRDHSEIPELMEVLGLDGQGKPIKDEKRWEQALQARKGQGSSMAAQMKEVAAATVATNETVATQ